MCCQGDLVREHLVLACRFELVSEQPEEKGDNYSTYSPVPQHLAAATGAAHAAAAAAAQQQQDQHYAKRKVPPACGRGVCVGTLLGWAHARKHAGSNAIICARARFVQACCMHAAHMHAPAAMRHSMHACP